MSACPPPDASLYLEEEKEIHSIRGPKVYISPPRRHILITNSHCVAADQGVFSLSGVLEHEKRCCAGYGGMGSERSK